MNYYHRRPKCQKKSINPVNVHIPAAGTVIARLVWRTTRKTDQEQTAGKQVMRMNPKQGIIIRKNFIDNLS